VDESRADAVDTLGIRGKGRRRAVSARDRAMGRRAGLRG